MSRPATSSDESVTDARNIADELDLVARLRANDTDAFGVLMRDYGGRVWAVARRLLGNDEDASDAVQEAMISAFRSIGGFTGASRLSTWLHRIAVNASLMRLRTRRRRNERPIDDLLPAFLDDGHQAQPAVEWRRTAQDVVQDRETREAVRHAIERLPDSFRTVLLLRDIEELDTRETAQILNIEENAVKVRLHRARQALRTLLEREFGTELPAETNQGLPE